ncbi:MAG: YdcF family protein [Rhizobiaceae bacterium]|nr:YdcF family protein [Rhizobiaceae bacterium]MCV0405231.1 YdcF family protein [Rhizobiaceae bacterium]
MTFVLSKVFWALVQPLSLVALLILASLVARWLSWRGTGTLLSVLALMILFVAAFTSAGALMLLPLEKRHPRPEPAPERVAGIIVLGGGFEGGINMARGGYDLNSGGDRMVETAILARRYPDARVVVTGGTGTLVLQGEGDAATAPRLLEALGVDRERLVLENDSRNTHENATYTRRLVSPAEGETWLLVTSAFHMPRSVALFERAGFAVTPWPVDYRTRGNETVELFADNPVDSLQTFTLGIREWTGLFAYWVMGRIDTPFPGA